MSHELRTPMNAILGYSEMLVEEAEDLGQEDFNTGNDRLPSLRATPFDDYDQLDGKGRHH